MQKLHLIFITFLVSVMANAQMVLEYEIPEAGDSIALPLNGTVDVTVDWGDGTQEDFTQAGSRWHIFETVGSKTVTITGTLTHFGNALIEKENLYLTKVTAWDNLGITNLSFAFKFAKILTEVPNHLPPNVIYLGKTFLRATSFNHPIGDWNTSNVINMTGIFQEASSFNQPIGEWNTEAVTVMEDMFYLATSFNQPIGDWDVSNVTSFYRMFFIASSFNRPLENWNIEKARNMISMFFQAEAFNQSLGNWNISSIKSMETMFFQNSLCTENYDATLIGWASQTISTGAIFHAGDSKYSAASEAARATLAEKWTITDGGLGTTEADKCSPVLSADSFFSINSLEFYPNPVLDVLYINSTSSISFSIYDLTGNILQVAEGSVTEIDLSNLSSGVYILQIESEAGIQTERFTKL